MKIVSIEPTPSPNSMKINLDTELPQGHNVNYKSTDSLVDAPEYVSQLFAIKGVKGIYHVLDFIALERNPKVAWENILPLVHEVLGFKEELENQSENLDHSVPTEDAFGEVKVWIQMFRGIPMQVKLQDGEEEFRFGLPDMFKEAAMKASPASSNLVMERQWVEQTPRYGSVDEIGNEVVEEIQASFDRERLEHLVKIAFQEENIKEESRQEVTIEMFNDPDWKVRYAALDRIQPTFANIDILNKALEDSKASIRRLATAYLGMIEEPEVLPYVYKALKDSSVAVRRTAGDCISDLGFKEAMPEMIESLNDSSKLVRWRAAMYLYEVGDEGAIPALRKALNDSEFEVRMQVKMALSRIEGGEEAKGSVWHQMTQARKQTN
ncbi:conserved virulence factor C family protein [Bacillaceae bacterium S4-13-58]